MTARNLAPVASVAAARPGLVDHAPALESPAPASPPGQTAGTTRPMWGVALMVTATVFFACGDVLTKVLSGSLPPVEIAWLRYVTLTAILIPFAWRRARGLGLRSHRLGLQVVRGLGMVGSAMFFILGLPFLPVADAT